MRNLPSITEDFDKWFKNNAAPIVTGGGAWGAGLFCSSCEVYWLRQTISGEEFCWLCGASSEEEFITVSHSLSGAGWSRVTHTPWFADDTLDVGGMYNAMGFYGVDEETE